MIMAAAGGALKSLYSLAKAFPNLVEAGTKTATVRLASNILTGLSAGCLAYFLASWNILGIRVDTTSLRGFAVLGFLFAYIGVESVMKIMTQKGRGGE